VKTEHALPAAVGDTVARVLADSGTKSVLIIGSLAIPVLANQSDVQRLPAAIPPEQLPAARVDLAVVADALADLPRDKAVALLASLRDVHARRVLVIDIAREDDPHGWHDADFRAFGFRRLLSHTDAGRHWRLHEFSIDTYKTTPDWLNAKYWAHPQRFDKFRW